jgi:carboxypeptidase C (cathepsin A)
MYAGYLPVRNGDANLYYVLVEASANKETAPLIIFMNGGPGCSSLVQLFYVRT